MKNIKDRVQVRVASKGPSWYFRETATMPITSQQSPAERSYCTSVMKGLPGLVLTSVHVCENG